MKLSVKLEHPNAVMPTRVHEDDIGFDVIIIDIFKVVNDSITMYETGIAVKPDDGYYVEVVPRSSFSKTGYVLANSIGIIDPNYRGTIKIAVIKVDKNMPDLPVPYKGFQLIVRKVEKVELKQVFDLDKTSRGDGGFGSTS
jgi:dUTP pyrophosphatase